METTGSEELLVVNGVDVRTGAYLTRPLPLADLARSLRADAGLPPGSGELRRRRHDDEAHLGVAYGRSPDDVASSGWGVVVARGVDPAVLEALAPLLRLRQEQAGERYKRLDVRRDESKDDFLARYGMGPSVVDPRRVPYYLLLVGGPEQISFEFQYQLAVSYAVGRLDLPRAEDYAGYVASVLRAEQPPGLDAGPSDDPRVVHLLATRHDADPATQLSASHLVEPLAVDLREMTGAWRVSTDVGDAATRARLHSLLTSPEGPDILFTACHGLGGLGSAPSDTSGALLCQDSPGPAGETGPVPEGHYLAAHHLAAGTAVRPRAVIAFACFGAGTPRVPDQPAVARDARQDGAGRSFTAPLPQRLLSEPGGALAFVGHVDKAWSCSFVWKGGGAQVTPFTSLVLAMMDGVRVGAALESLTSRYAELATELALLLDGSRRYGKRVGDAQLVGLWTAMHDARGWVLLGDPAVRVAPRGAARLGGG